MAPAVLEEIVEARLSDIFDLIENVLKKIKRNELLPGGIIWTGGGSNIQNLEELSRNALKLPTQTGHIEMFGNMRKALKLIIGLRVS